MMHTFTHTLRKIIRRASNMKIFLILATLFLVGCGDGFHIRIHHGMYLSLTDRCKTHGGASNVEVYRVTGWVKSSHYYHVNCIDESTFVVQKGDE